MDSKQNIYILRTKLSLLEKILDILRKIFLLQTKKEKLEWEKIAYAIGKNYKIDIEAFVATIWAESEMNPNATNYNKDGTTDYGICQFNDYWYKDKITPYDAINDPELALNIMAQMWEKGRQKDWIAYRSGAYKKYLKTEK